MQLANILETIMLICFGCAWPLSIYKSWASRATGGKSLMFLVVLLLGYVAGLAKCGVEGLPSPMVFGMYVLNTILVSADALLYFRNRAIERRQAQLMLQTVEAVEEAFDDVTDLR